MKILPAAVLVFILSAGSAQADERSTDCRLFGSVASCDDGTEYNIYNGYISGPDGEHYMLSKEPSGADDQSENGDYYTNDGTKIHVSDYMIKVEYSDSVLRERKERAENRKKQKKEFDKSLGKNDPVTVDADGFFE